MNIFNFKMENLPCIVHIITSKNKVLVIRLTAHQRVITLKSDFLSDFLCKACGLKTLQVISECYLLHASSH